LWYGDIGAAGKFSWHEYGFSGLMELTTADVIALPPDERAAAALCRSSVEYQVVSEMRNVDQDIEAYVARLAQLLAPPLA